MMSEWVSEMSEWMGVLINSEIYPYMDVDFMNFPSFLLDDDCDERKWMSEWEREKERRVKWKLRGVF